MPDLLGLKVAQAGRQVDVQISGLNPELQLKLVSASGREVCGMRGVAVKCIDITQNSDCEGSIPAPH